MNLKIWYPYIGFLGLLVLIFLANSNSAEKKFDVVCNMEVNQGWGIHSNHKGDHYYFCNERCKEAFEAQPDKFLETVCLICEGSLKDKKSYSATYLEKEYQFCSTGHRSQFKEDPAQYFMHSMWGIPSEFYYASIAIVLVVSFGLFDLLSRRNQVLSLELAQKQNGFPLNRLDLFSYPKVKAALRSRFFRFSLQLFFVLIFAIVIIAGIFGNQNPALNIAPILTWTIWWGLLPVVIIFAGKIWCYVCPWDAASGWIEKLSFWKKSSDGLSLNKKWPRIIRNISLATLLFIGLTWVELGFGVTMKPRITAYLAISMLLLALVSALLFDRKSFCRYGCLVGRVSGLYAMFSGTEIRSRCADTCLSCKTKECVKGSETAYGCPTFLYPGKLDSNTYCIQCMECVQACPHDNLTMNLRPLGADLEHEGKPRSDEAYLALLMLSITGFHGLTMTPVWAELVAWIQDGTNLGNILAFSSGMLVILLAPIVIYALLVYISKYFGTQNQLKSLSYTDYFVRYAYALLPIALFYHIAHNLEHLLMEGPKVIALMSDPMGWNWNLFGTATWSIPPLISLDKLWLAQIFLVLVGHVYSLWIAQKTSIRIFGSPRAAFKSQLPMLVGMILFSVFSLWLLKQPMEMRTSAM